MKVLIAEDDRVSRKVLEKYLIKWGYEVVCTQDGDHAWTDLQTQGCQLAILDWQMPGLSGVDLCHKIRSHEDLTHLYIILLTGKNSRRDMVEGLNSGADDYVVKPFDPLELNSRMRVGCRLVESRLLLQQKNVELNRYAREMESLAEERASMLIHSDRLASLGTLSAGIAHEINNPSTFIAGNAQTLERCWPTIEEALKTELNAYPEKKRRIDLILSDFPKMVTGIRNGVKRITSIVSGLKTFSRVGKNELEPFDMNQCIENALLLCANRLKYHVRVNKTLAQQISLIRGDSQKMEQVFVNLFVNAADAVEGKANGETGLLGITTTTLENQLQVVIEDNGPGIAEETLADIWKPFYTTKEPGRGTGLGLAISQGIVHDHQGEITVTNGPLGGACFTLTFPIEEVV